MNDQAAEHIRIAEYFDNTPFFSPQGHMDARLVFTHNLFFAGGGTFEGQMRCMETLAMLADDISDYLVKQELPHRRLSNWNPERLRARCREFIERSFRDKKSKLDFDLSVHGEAAGEICAFGGSVTSGKPISEGDADLNRLEASTTLGWDAANSYRRQIDRMIAAATKLQPQFGLAGYGLSFDRSGASTSSKARLVPKLWVWPGLHCGMDNKFMVSAAMWRPTPDRYFSINWLTVLADELLEQLPKGAIDQLPAHCPVHGYPGGVVIQAGPLPVLGPENDGKGLDSYRAVSAALRPLRFEDYRVGVLPVPKPHDSLAETLKWVRRFD